MREPGAIAYAFGADSYAAHRRAAERAGLGFAECRRCGLADDLDLPEDLALLN